VVTTRSLVLRFAVGALILGSGLSLMAPAGMASASAPQITYTTSLSGYQPSLLASGTPTMVSVSFKVPSVSKCSGTSADQLILIGPQLFISNTTSQATPGLEFGCHAGASTYQGALFGSTTVTVLSAKVSAKDSLTLSASMNASMSSMTFIDHTTGFTQSATDTGGTATGVFLGALGVNGSSGSNTLLAVPKFSKVSFTAATVNGSSLATWALGSLYEFIRTTNGSAPPSGSIQIVPGKLATSKFTLTYKHS
jgi:hypothetical protein